jgi:hypothetical protein
MLPRGCESPVPMSLPGRAPVTGLSGVCAAAGKAMATSAAMRTERKSISLLVGDIGVMNAARLQSFVMGRWQP